MQIDRPTSGTGRHTPRSGHDCILRFHDVRNVVGCLAMIGEELRNGGAGRQAILGDRILRACERLLRLGGGDGCGRTPSATFPALLEDVAALARSLAGPLTHVEAGGPDAPIRSSAEMALFRILLNLASNAVRAANDCGGGVVRISGSLSPTGAAVCVENDGASLAPHGRSAAGGVAPRPPCPTDRLRPASSGLGLVIAEALAHDLGGALCIGRRRRAGWSLTVVLPRGVFAADGRPIPETGAAGGKRASVKQPPERAAPRPAP